MIAKYFLAPLFVIFLSSCAHRRQADQSNYEGLSNFRANLQACFNEGFVSPKFFSDSDKAVDIILSLVIFDRNVLNNMTDDAFEKTVATRKLCRETEAEGYKVQSGASQMRDNHNQGQRELSDAIKNFKIDTPIYCNRIGTLTHCY